MEDAIANSKIMERVYHSSILRGNFMKRKILTVKNRAILYKKLRAYLVEILEDEENFDSFEDLYQDAYRVKVYGYTKTLTPALITQWLTGLPIGTE